MYSQVQDLMYGAVSQHALCRSPYTLLSAATASLQSQQSATRSFDISAAELQRAKQPNYQLQV